MKKFATLVLAAGLVVSSFAGSASAGEFKPFAQFAEEFTYGDAGSANVRNDGKIVRDSYDAENFNAATRIRFGFDYVASEDLSATILFQYGGHNWGEHTIDTRSFDDQNADLKMRLAYIDWTIPGTEVKARMGRQAVVAPSYAFGSAILDSRADAVSLTGNVNENIALGLTWMRLNSENVQHGQGANKPFTYEKANGFKAEDDSDAIMITSEFAYDGFKVAPWAMYISKDDNVAYDINWQYANNAAYSYVLGASFELSMFDPFVFAIDGLYSHTSWDQTLVKRVPYLKDEFSGWYVGANAAYKFSNGTAALKGWYASGKEINDLEHGKLNTKGFAYLDGGFSATTMLFGDNIIGNDGYNTLHEDTPFGTWGLVAEYAGFSFIDKLTHTARVAYVTGTNEYTDKRLKDRKLDFTDLTEDDNLIEIDFNSTYEIYKNLSATLELGYIFVDMDNLAANNKEHDDVFRSALTFVYNF